MFYLNNAIENLSERKTLKNEISGTFRLW